MSTGYEAIAQQVGNQRPDLLRTNTFASCAEFCRLVALAINAAMPGTQAGLLSKSEGEQGYTWPNGVRTSHDVVAFPDGRRADILGNASDGEIANGGKGGAASVIWDDIPPNKWRPSNVWTPVESVGGTTTGGGTTGGGTVTPPPVKCGYDAGAVAKLTGDVNALRNEIAHLKGTLEALGALASRLDEEWAARVWNATDPKKAAAVLKAPPYEGVIRSRVFGSVSVTLTPQTPEPPKE